MSNNNNTLLVNALLEMIDYNVTPTVNSDKSHFLLKGTVAIALPVESNEDPEEELALVMKALPKTIQENPLMNFSISGSYVLGCKYVLQYVVIEDQFLITLERGYDYSDRIIVSGTFEEGFREEVLATC